MIFRSPAAPDPARRSKIDTFNKTRTRQHKQPEDHIARTRGHTGPSCNNTKGISKDNILLKPYFTSVDATRHTEGKAVLNVVVAAASAAAAVVVVAVRQTDAQNGCLVGGWVGCGGGGRRRRMVVVVVMLMLMMGKIFPILYIQTPNRPPQRLLLVILYV